MIFRVSVFISLVLPYTLYATDDSMWDDTYSPDVFSNTDIIINETNDKLISSIIDIDGLQLETVENDNDTANDGLRLIVLFLKAYCSQHNGLSFCMTYNRCKNKTSCNTNEFLNDNSSFISELMSKITNINDTHELIELTDKMHDWINFALVGVIVVLKIIISYLLERKFKLCGRIKTRIKEKKRESAAGEPECDSEELKIMVANPPPLLPVHAQPSVEPVYDVPKNTPVSTAMHSVSRSTSFPDKLSG